MTRTISFVLCGLTLGAALLRSPMGQAAEPTYTNSIGMEFVLIPAGTFPMGSADADREAAANERPRHPVTITKPFYVGKNEVTQAQWQAVMGSSPYALERSNPYYGLPGMAAPRLSNPANPEPCRGTRAGVHQAPQREGGPQPLSPADRGGMGVCRAAGRMTRVLLRRRHEAAWALRVVWRRLRVGLHPSGRAEGAERLGPTTCTATSGSGCRIGTTRVITRTVRRRIRRDQPQGRSASCVEAAAPDRHKLAVGLPPLVRPGLSRHQHWLSAGALDRTVSDGSLIGAQFMNVRHDLMRGPLIIQFRSQALVGYPGSRRDFPVIEGGRDQRSSRFSTRRPAYAKPQRPRRFPA